MDDSPRLKNFKSVLTMYLLHIKQFLRSPITILALILLFLIGITAILIGKQFLQKQEETIAKVTEHQRSHFERNIAVNKEMGLLLYYLRFSLISKPDKLAGISIGQRDINPGIQSVTIRTLEAQKYDTDLTNPVQLHSGNLDLGFVIIYLFPLVIIGLTFNLLSEDREAGTWKLLVVQSRSALQVLLAKFLIRGMFISAVLLVLILIAAWTLSVPINEAFIALVVLCILYITFWFALSFWLSMFKKSSGFNVVALLTIWVALTILAPATLNNIVASTYPVPEAFDNIIKQRDGYHKKWDMAKEVTMDKFYAQYPQFKNYGVENENFWIWYYAMQHMGDEESVHESNAMRRKLQQRDKMSRSVAFAIPTMHTQMQLNDLAQTSLMDYLRLLDSAEVFHERTRLYFYPKIFDNADVTSENWAKFKPEFLQPRQTVNWPSIITPFATLITILGVWALFRSKAIYSI
jgi:ABC-2 type transport system permease protein